MHKPSYPHTHIHMLHCTSSTAAFAVASTHSNPGAHRFMHMEATASYLKGLLKRYLLPISNMLLFQHQNEGKPPFTRQCSGVFHVRIPVCFGILRVHRPFSGRAGQVQRRAQGALAKLARRLREAGRGVETEAWNRFDQHARDGFGFLWGMHEHQV